MSTAPQFYIPVFVILSEKEKEYVRVIDEKGEFEVTTLHLDSRLSENLAIWNCLSTIFKKSLSEDHDVIGIFISSGAKTISLQVNGLLENIIDAYKNNFHILIKDGLVKNAIPVTQRVSFIDEFSSFSFAFFYHQIFYEFLKSKYRFSRSSIWTFLSNLTERKACFSFKSANESKKIVPETLINVIVPFRNEENFLKQCYESLLSQEYQNYNIFFIDDASDNIDIDFMVTTNKIFYIRNEIRKYALYNIHTTLQNYNFPQESIIVILDGDDYLLHEWVLAKVNLEYASQDCLLTYGQYITSNGFVGHCSKYEPYEFAKLRSRGWRASHLKTFKYKLYQQYLLQDPDLSFSKDKSGQFYKTTYDVALMTPLLEIAGFKKVHFIEEPLYVYRIHSNNDSHVNGKAQMDTEKELYSKQQFKIYTEN